MFRCARVPVVSLFVATMDVLEAFVSVVCNVPEILVVMVSVEDEALTIEGDENSDVRDVVTPVVTVPGEIIVKVSLHEISGERCWHSTVICSVESVASR